MEPAGVLSLQSSFLPFLHISTRYDRVLKPKFRGFFRRLHSFLECQKSFVPSLSDFWKPCLPAVGAYCWESITVDSHRVLNFSHSVLN